MSKENRKIIQAPSLPSRENVISAQFTNLISVFVQAGNFLVANQIHGARIDEDGTPRGGIMDGGAKCAVETTMINLCDRFDKILKDDSHWTMEPLKGLTESVKALYDAQTDALKAQSAALRAQAAVVLSPHNTYKPQLVKMSDGSWLAFHGNPQDLENALCGVGNCPAAALEAFDALFTGQVPDNLREWLQTHTVDTNKQNEKEPLDETGTGNPETPAS
jgi:hypothetical protein